MKTKAINVFLVLVFLTGLFVVLNYQISIEKKKLTKDIYTKGKHLVSLIALRPISSFEGDQNYFLRTLVEYSSKEGLVYCYITRENGKKLVSFVLTHPGQDFSDCSEIYKIGTTSLAYHSSEIECSDGRIYEFSKPLFENGEPSGAVRIGLMIEPVSILTKERISLVGMLSFFIIASIILVYFGILQAIKPINSLFSKSTSSSPNAAANADLVGLISGEGIHGMVSEIQSTMGLLKKQLNNIESRNKNLSFQIGVVKFQKNQIQNIINKINYGIIILDVQDNVIQINDYMLNNIGKVREDAIDHPLEEVITDPTLNHFISQQENIVEHLTSHQVEFSIAELKETYVFSVTCAVLSGEDRQVAGKLLTFNDITSQKEAEKNTIAFVAHLSHELMTPLTTIQSYSEMLMDGEIEDTETQKEFYNTINKETERLTRLIKDLLSLSRIEMGSLTINKDIVMSEMLFNDCIVAIEGSAKKKGITIEKHVPDNFPSFMGDKELLKGAIINLLGNAVKYTPEKGELVFGLRKEEDVIIFDISDTGYGMSQDDLGHIFEKFYRSSNPEVADKQGTGLGLSIASEIIALHGGQIDVQSELGRGTYFIISIPLEEYYIDQ
ncbi:MAG: ATP-binding protein [Desulfobacterales bacterium]|nr:ATP-binding protein [Desulfobacterales bacterium]MDX2512247.1 ATP-binding protein [Desulfobacterales bacterium]